MILHSIANEIWEKRIRFASRGGRKLRSKIRRKQSDSLHYATKEILMFAYMNAEALDATLSTGLAHYWSRSRQKLWRKGEASGMIQRVRRALIDDDQDCLIIEVDFTKPTAGGDESSCHVGYRSCFYREIGEGSETRKLVFTETEKTFNPQHVYGDAPNPTKL